MNTFRQLRDRLRDPGPCKPGKDPADHDADNLVRVLDDLLTALAEQDPAAEFQASLDKALADKVFAPIVDAQASRVCRPEPRDAQPERLGPPDLASAAARWPKPGGVVRVLYTPPKANDAPVLPPGCRLERDAAVPNAWHVGMRDGLLGGPRGGVAIWTDVEEAAREAWRAFGAFMSREDYEVLVGEAGNAAVIQGEVDGWRAKASALTTERDYLGREVKRLSAIVVGADQALTEAGETGPRIADGIRSLAITIARSHAEIRDWARMHNEACAAMQRAHETLDAAGVDRESTFPPGGPVARKVHGLAERINMLASKVGDVQTGEAYGREVLEQEATRLRALLAAEQAKTEHWRARANDLDAAKATADKRTRVADAKVTALVGEQERLRDWATGLENERDAARRDADLERKIARQMAQDLDDRTREWNAALEAFSSAERELDAARQERSFAEKRTEAHRLEIGRLTDTIQRLRSEVAEARAALARYGEAAIAGVEARP